MVQTKNKASRQKRQEKILRVARDLFARQGFNATGVAQICELSEVAPQQLYRDFSGKENIVEAIVEADILELFQKISGAELAATDHAQDWDRWVTNIFLPLIGVRDWSLFLEIQAQAARNDRIAEIVRRFDTEIRRSIDQALGRFSQGRVSAETKHIVTEIIMLTIFGMAGRRMAHPSIDAEGVIGLIKSVLAEEILGDPREPSTTNRN